MGTCFNDNWRTVNVMLHGSTFQLIQYFVQQDLENAFQEEHVQMHDKTLLN